MSRLLIETANVTNAPSDDLALTNCLIVSPHDVHNTEDCPYVLINRTYVCSIKTNDGMKRGQVGYARWHRQWMNLCIGDEIKLQLFDGYLDHLVNLVIKVGYMTEKGEKIRVNPEDITEIFRGICGGQVLSENQVIVFVYKGVFLKAIVVETHAFDCAKGQRGILVDQTKIIFKSEPFSGVKLDAQNVLLEPNFNFEDMGIGGLGDQFGAIFRRAFASRICPTSLLSRLGIQHVKGLLLFGPPGTGKTLIARQIAKFLNAREPKIVNGPEVMNKYVGQSEENIRNLFADAEMEYREAGDDSGLHIIVLDELDAICKQRGNANNGAGDSVVNQLLAKIDGVEQLNNVLIIGMTNRLDMIDEALLRPGRLEVHIEISLPDEQGRLEIINIHTLTMRKHSMLADDVDLTELAALTKNFSGAEIAGLIKSATSFALNQNIKVETGATVTNVENMKLLRADFMRALSEVKPAYGVREEELQRHIIEWGPEVRQVLDAGKLYVQQVCRSEYTPRVSILLHGPAGSGKTALAATIALASSFPFVKVISPVNMIGITEQGKVAAIAKAFHDAYKSELSFIVIDDIEHLIDWVPIGPRFSNAVLQTLISCMKQPPPHGKKVIILGTSCSQMILQQLAMLEMFDCEISTPLVTSIVAVDKVVARVNLFDDDVRQKVMKRLESQSEMSFSIAIGCILMICETARQHATPETKFEEAFLQIKRDKLMH